MNIDWTKDDAVVLVRVGGIDYADTSKIFRAMQEVVNAAPIYDPTTGRKLISGNGELFKYVLHYLRHDCLSLPDDFKEYKALTEDATSYKLKGLVDLIEEEQYPSLNLSDDVTSDPDLKQSMRLAQVFMASPRFREIYRQEYKSNIANERMKTLKVSFEVKVEFKRDEDGRAINNLAWGKRSDPTPTYIRINDIFRQRLEKLTKFDLNERCSIVCMMAVLIIHELGHLMLRWRGPAYFNTPDKYNSGWEKPEAGYYLESRLFGSIVHIRVPRNMYDPEDTTWTSDMRIIGLATRRTRLISKRRKIFHSIIEPELIRMLVKGVNVPYDDYLPLPTDPTKSPPMNVKEERAFRPACELGEVDDLDDPGDNDDDDDDEEDIGLPNDERILLGGCDPDYKPS